MNDKKYRYLAFATILGFFLFRVYYIATTHYDLVEDEAYFWDWSRHPAWGYYDQGPMVAWVIRFFTSFLPLSEFSVRLGAPVFAAMTTVVIYFLASEIVKSARLGFIIVLIFHITPIGAIGGILYSYYSLQMFFMALTAFFLWRLVRDGKGWWWYLIGLSLGLGLLSHHMFTLFTAEVGLFILLSEKNRKWLKSRELYIALLIEFLVASPLIIWNLTHDLVMAEHALGLMSNYGDFGKTFLEFLGGQAGVQTPLFFLAVIYGISVSGYRGIKYRDDAHLMLFCLSAPFILFIVFLCLGGRTEANWPVSAYITGGVSAVWIFNEKYAAGKRITRNLIKGALAFTVLFGFSVTTVAFYPGLLYSAFGVSIPPGMDPANKLYVWKKLGKEVSRVLKTMPEGAFVAGWEYGLIAELAFYVEGNPEVYAIPLHRRSSQYDFWNSSIDVEGKDAVIANGGPMPDDIKELFDHVELASRFVILDDRSGKIRDTFYIYKGRGYKGIAAKPSSY